MEWIKRGMKLLPVLVAAIVLAGAMKLDEESLGGIKPRLMTSEVMAVAGQPQHKSNLGAKGCLVQCQAWEYSRPGLVIEFCKDASEPEERDRQLRAVEIRTDRNSISQTGKGMRIWNTMHEVRMAYPDADVTTIGADQEASVHDPATSRTLLFHFKDDRVSEIRLFETPKCRR